MPRDVRLEMIPNDIVKQVILKPEDLTSSQALFSQGLGRSEELIFRCKWDDIEEVENEVVSINGVLIFDVIYGEIQVKLKYFNWFKQSH